ncbi:MAG TPA: protein kinase [Gammaproteobacteria bacterium]
MRLLLIDDDAEYRKILRYHVEVEWPQAIVVDHQPSSTGRGPRDIPLVGFDAVLLGHPLADEQGFMWLDGLAERDDCPPVLLFADPSDEWLAVDALKAGAASYFPKRKLQHRRLVAALREAVEQGVSPGRARAFARRTTPAASGRTASPAPSSTGDRASDEPLPAHLRELPCARRHRFVAQLYASDLSTVYLADDEETGERVVCKVVENRPGKAGARLFERFLLEYQLIAQLRHPHVVRIIDLGIADDHAYIVMEYFAAGSLAERLADGPLGADAALRYARQIGAALAAIHSAGILHRDLKPGNVMFRADDTLALIDFGLAKALRLEASLTGTAQIFGTPHYMSPEQGHADPIDERSDLYSLGCILYEMLTGEKPFTASTAMGVIYKHSHAPRPKLPAAHAALQPLLDRLLAVEPGERFQSASEWLRALDRIGSAQ